MKMIVLNKHSYKVKIWNVEMPNAPYSKRSVIKKKLKPKKLNNVYFVNNVPEIKNISH